MKRFREWVSIYSVKAPKLIVLLAIVAANLVFISIAAFIIMACAPAYLDSPGYWDSVYYAVTMFLSGYIEVVVEDVGSTAALFVVFCCLFVTLGLIIFTGAVIGYVSDFISSFIEDADSSSRRLRISRHTIILNWNTRASEIINELLCKNKREKVVILVNGDKDDILSDINERLSDTLEAENEAIKERGAQMGLLKRWRFIRKSAIRNRLTIIVREGDSWSARQLSDIAIEDAKTVLILNDGITGARDAPDRDDRFAKAEKWDPHTIKTLLQVVHLTADDETVNSQQVVVEVEDQWTLALANTIINHKSNKSRNNIVPIAVNHIMGFIFSQVSIMPDLNIVYSELFSNKDSAFYTRPAAGAAMSEDEFVSDYLDSHIKAIPLTVMRASDNKANYFFMAENEEGIDRVEHLAAKKDLSVTINPDYAMRNKRVVMLGHNSKSKSIMEGYESFSMEWKEKDGPEVLDVILIDNEQYLAEQGSYEQYPFISKVIASDVHDKDFLCGVIDEAIDAEEGDLCILILSDDTVSGEEIDADALAHLILVEDILRCKIHSDPGFDPGKVEVVVEILDPKNYDIISNYSTNNIVVSNRYISKIIGQVGEKGALFDFYYDLLTYDDASAGESDSKEIYIKKASDFFIGIPGRCTAADLIRAVYRASPDSNKSVVLGLIRPGGEMTLFEGDQSLVNVELSGDDKLILFSNH